MNNIQEDNWSEDSWSHHSGMPNDELSQEPTKNTSDNRRDRDTYDTNQPDD